MTVLALDLSTEATGWAVGENNGGRPLILETGVIEPKKTAPLVVKFSTVCDGIAEVVLRYGPTEVLIEELTHFRGAATIRALAGLQGAVRFDLWTRALLEVKMVRVSEARKALGINQGRKATERGPAFKNLIKDRVKARLASHYGVKVESYDEADAVVILLGGYTWGK